MPAHCPECGSIADRVTYVTKDDSGKVEHLEVWECSDRQCEWVEDAVVA